MKLLSASLLAAAGLTVSAPALAQSVEDGLRPKLEEAVQQFNKGELGQVDALVTALLPKYEAAYRNEKRRIFCSEDATETVRYMALAGELAKKDPKGPKEAVAIPNDWCLALWLKGFVLTDVEKYAEALPYLQRAAAMAPLYSKYLSELGYAYQGLSDWNKSLDAYRRAESTAKSSTEDEQRGHLMGVALRGQGYALVELGKWDEAEAAYRKSLQVDPEDEMSEGELQYIAKNRPK